MSEAQLRPRYKYLLPHTAGEIREMILGALKNSSSNPKSLQQRSTAHHVILSYPREHRHFWSPIVDINLEPRPDQTSIVRILIGPEPSIWTMFMFFYILGGFIILLGMIFGLSHYMLGKGSWYFSLIPIGMLIIAFFYFAALAGKGKANEQMHEMKSFVEEATGNAIYHDPELS